MEQRAERILVICLGGLWLLDGILQLQPAMFTSVFVSTVLTPNLQGQPAVLGSIIAFGIQIFDANIFWFNLASALIQLLIGALLIIPLWLPSRNGLLRFGLWLSVVWALIVWIFGEGFGNLATGMATFYTGAPGSALLYLTLALFLLYALQGKGWPLKKLPMIAGVLFLACAALNFTSPVLTNLLMIDALACLGIFLILVPTRSVAWVAIIFLCAVWWLGQGFGGLQTFPGGTATDPNSAPLFALFLLPIFFAGD